MNAHFHADYAQAAFPILPELRPARLRRLLVVEDDADLRAVFERVGASVDPHLVMDWAESVPDAMQRMNRERYDLVLSDFLLDERGSGFSLKTWCEYNHPTTLFAMMSAFPVADGARGSNPPIVFLPKPFTVGQLRSFLWALLLD